MRGHDWGEVVEPLINTELLTMIYRALGAKMGYRVQMDAVKVTEHDLLTVKDYAVFGSSVTRNVYLTTPVKVQCWYPNFGRSDLGCIKTDFCK